MTGFNRIIAAIAVTGAAVAISAAAAAYETDQFYNRSQPIADSTEVLNRKVNETLAEIVAEWRKDRDQKALVGDIYHRLGGHLLVDKLERWAIKSPEVEKLEMPRYDSIYSGLPIWSTRFTFLMGIGKTIRASPAQNPAGACHRCLSTCRAATAQAQFKESRIRVSENASVGGRAGGENPP